MLLRRHRHKQQKPNPPMPKKEEKPKVEKKSVDLDELTVPELKEKAKEKEIVGYSSMRREELVDILAGD